MHAAGAGTNGSDGIGDSESVVVVAVEVEPNVETLGHAAHETLGLLWGQHTKRVA